MCIPSTISSIFQTLISFFMSYIPSIDVLMTSQICWWDQWFYWYPRSISCLVGGFNDLEKYEFVNGKDDIPYIMEEKNLWNNQPSCYITIIFQTFPAPVTGPDFGLAPAESIEALQQHRHDLGHAKDVKMEMILSFFQTWRKYENSGFNISNIKRWVRFVGV